MLGQDVGEAGVLGEKAIARVHGFRPGDLAGRDDRGNVEVAVARRRRADAHALVGKPHVHRIGVRRRMDGHRLDAEFPAGAQHAECDFTPVGNEDLVEHRPYSIATRGSPYSTGWPFSTNICVTLPERGACIWFSVFIASMMSSVWPSFTDWPSSMKLAEPGEGAR